MSADYMRSRRIGIPIGFERRDGHCVISMEQFEVLSRFRVTTQRSLHVMGAELGRSLYVEDGFQEFELTHSQPARVPLPEAQSASLTETSESAQTGLPTESPEESAAIDLPISKLSPPEIEAVEPAEQGPLVAAAPGAVIDRFVLDARLRAGPPIMRVDGTVIPWAIAAPPKSAPSAPASASTLVFLKRIGEETLLRTPLTRYRALDAAQARAINVGAVAVFEKGEEHRFLLAKAGAIQLQGDLFDPTNVGPENES